jgi:hypothetical protein
VLAEPIKVIFEASYLEKTFQIMTPATKANPRLIPSTYRTEPNFMPPEAFVSDISTGRSFCAVMRGLLGPKMK